MLVSGRLATAVSACMIASALIGCSDSDDGGATPLLPEPDGGNVDSGAGGDAASDIGAETDAATSDAPGSDGGWEGRHTFTGPAGSRDYEVHIPAGLTGAAPMVVVLHGCAQDAGAMRELTRFDQLADKEGFVVVFPEQPVSANIQRCWNWFLPSNQDRNSGEALILGSIVQEVQSHVLIDSKRVHVTGLSAGGAMAVVLASTWPDLFASVGVASGCAFKGTPCLQKPTSEPVDALAGYVVSAMGWEKTLIPMIAMQGDLDTTVPPQNLPILMGQWLMAADKIDDDMVNGSISSTPSAQEKGTSQGGLAYDIERYAGPSGSIFAETWLVHGMEHAWSGGPAMAWSEPKGPDATAVMWAFMKTRSK